MCGIAGVWTRGAGHDVWRIAARLGPALRHRGPDEAGWLVAWAGEGRAVATRQLESVQVEGAAPPDVVLAHRRLSIVDLATGWQPIPNETSDVWIVYNGEIYNHLALRHELEALGHRFSTQSDTEMVVHAYEAWGCQAFARFNGIFALALWDMRRRRLVLARDPIGVKPLYVGRGPRGVWFASEVKAGIQAELCRPALNRSALDLYLAFRFVPSPHTLFEGVSRVPPGHWLETLDGGSRWGDPVRFAPEPAAQDERPPLREWVERLSAATCDAVAGQMMSDVPVGALLSGGLDSSLVVTGMRMRQAAPVATYAIGYRDAGSESELEIARRAAEVLGTAHHGVAVDDARFLSAWASTISQIDEPVATPGHVLVGMLCRTVKQDLKVALTGQGADEPLGGYLRHSVERWARFLCLRPVAAGLRLGARLSPRRESAQRLAAVASQVDLSRRIAAAFEVFTPAQRQALLTPAARGDTAPDAALEPVRRWLSGTEGLDSLNRLLYVDARLSLADDLLLGADKVSMANSVELRVPFLDLGYLAVAERIPGRLKVTLGRGRKRLQQLVGRRLLPASLARSLVSPVNGWRRKRGFDVPVGRWFGAGKLDGVASLLAGPGATLLEYLSREAVLSLLNEHAAGRRDHTRRLVALLTLESWHRAFIAGDPDAVARVLGAAEGADV